MKLNAAEYHRQELDVFRRLFEEAKMWRALFNAVEYCHAVEMPLPEWAAIAVLNLIQDRHFADGEAGGYGSAAGKNSMDYAHFLRRNAVRGALRQHDLEDLPDRGRGRPSAQSGITKAAVLREAMDLLKGNRLARATSAAQMEESFRLVEESLKRKEMRFRFDLLLSV